MLDIDALLDSARDPFPGLRAFQVDEGLKFFGRDLQTQEVLRRLSTDRLVAVIGSSGCGKSSLVRAGVIPALQRGYLNNTSSRWRIAVMRPGAAPITHLAESLERDARCALTDSLRTTLGATSAGISEVLKHAGLGEDESVLIVVDQFEELFTFAASRSPEEAGDSALFVSMLLHATEQSAIPIYVVLTMRSDFLGDCAKFTGLAEALTRSQYLVPRMTREQRRECIVGPLRLVNAVPAPALVQQVLNDAGDDGDDLPVLQHALARTYERWKQHPTGEVSLDDYVGIGTVEDALANHGEQVMKGLAQEDLPIAEKIFRALTISVDGRATRRPTRLSRLYKIIDAKPVDFARVDRVVATFADRHNSFLTLSTAKPKPDTVVDITHESLIRKWPTLTAWTKDEARSAEWYEDLTRDVVRHQAGEAGLWRDPDLTALVERRDRESWNAEWAHQYCPSDQPSFEATRAFLRNSVTARGEEKRAQVAQQRREVLLRRSLVGTIGLILVVTLVGVSTLYQRSQGQLQATETITQASVNTSDSEAKAQELNAQIEALRQQIASRPAETSSDLQVQLDKLLTSYNAAKTQSDADRAELAKLTQERAADKSATAAIVARVESLQRELNEVKQDKAALETRLANAQAASPSPPYPSRVPVQQGPPPSVPIEPPASGYATEEQAVRQVLDAYADAYNKRDVGLLRKVFPSVPNPDELQKVLSSMATFSVTLSNLRIVFTPTLSAAQVDGTIREAFTSKSSGRRQNEAARQWYLEKQKGQWFVSVVR